MEHIYQPSLLNENEDRTRSYVVNNLFFVAFFGGIFAIVVLGMQNAKWLKLEKKYIRILTILSGLLIIGKLIMVYAIGQGILAIDEDYIKVFGRIIAVAGYFIFFAFLNRPYKEHLVVGGQTESLWMPGFLACIVSGFIEFIAIAFLLAL
ncbi:hypothetical protein J2D69_12100 [Lysinibacillus sphaericus]|uniref:Uncharacterized protein n=4 Tax=Lysinibacillus TaxID=400634 RepID=B1HNF8_LYSSC|nr:MULTISPECIES: hypothetical protein [Lysinibacillus]MBE5083452.1 hypothetical protein [Bacillus thuringiensis]ACA40468.1 hypothetical protein Bsph_2939 [Lysinibacillus sphaericus C3-41]AMO33520.1 hypothetical protein AR327_14285 [Lysinibacillus sphaericus]AMR91374.1 hypothetical protein A1T07_14930 [Lysinibacillus sphaericus]ANA45422.1 hypothetical protein A2J09_07590 [Lysinibacillus sphaericus]